MRLMHDTPLDQSSVAPAGPGQDGDGGGRGPAWYGGLLTLFLHSPLQALCRLCQASGVSGACWERATQQMDTWMAEAGRVLVRARTLDFSYISFLSDDFLRLLILRFIFCALSLRMHKGFRQASMSPPTLPAAGIAGNISNMSNAPNAPNVPNAATLPTMHSARVLPASYPPLPENEVLGYAPLQRLMVDIAATMNSRHMFIEPSWLYSPHFILNAHPLHFTFALLLSLLLKAVIPARVFLCFFCYLALDANLFMQSNDNLYRSFSFLFLVYIEPFTYSFLLRNLLTYFSIEIHIFTRPIF